MSLVSWVQTLTLLNISGWSWHVCLVFVPLRPLFLQQQCLLREFTVASRPYRSWKLEWHKVLPDLWPCAGPLMVAFSLVPHTFSNKDGWGSAVLAKSSPLPSHQCVVVFTHCGCFSVNPSGRKIKLSFPWKQTLECFYMSHLKGTMALTIQIRPSLILSNVWPRWIF